MKRIFIPETLKIGFQKRSNTFTGNLSYIIYYDEKGKIRKEESWNRWRDHRIEPIEVDNKPMSGFIINKGIHRTGNHFGSGRHVIRVYDPRDFEFEISVDNLEYIIAHCDISKGEISGDFVYSYEGKELVLLPTETNLYKESIGYTEKRNEKLTTKDLVVGNIYSKKSDLKKQYIYLGFFDLYKIDNEEITFLTACNFLKKKHVFKNVINESQYILHEQKYFPLSPQILVETGVKCDDIDEVIDEFQSSAYFNGLEYKISKKIDRSFFVENINQLFSTSIYNAKIINNCFIKEVGDAILIININSGNRCHHSLVSVNFAILNKKSLDTISLANDIKSFNCYRDNVEMLFSLKNKFNKKYAWYYNEYYSSHDDLYKTYLKYVENNLSTADYDKCNLIAKTIYEESSILMNDKWKESYFANNPNEKEDFIKEIEHFFDVMEKNGFQQISTEIKK